MVVDRSAVLAILQLEPEAERFARRIEEADARLISSVSVLEAGIVAETRKGERGAQVLDAFLHEAGLSIQAFDAEQVELAHDAYCRFGKGFHEAALSLGDCAAWALS